MGLAPVSVQTLSATFTPGSLKKSTNNLQVSRWSRKYPYTPGNTQHTKNVLPVGGVFALRSLMSGVIQTSLRVNGSFLIYSPFFTIFLPVRRRYPHLKTRVLFQWRGVEYRLLAYV